MLKSDGFQRENLINLYFRLSNDIDNLKIKLKYSKFPELTEDDILDFIRSNFPNIKIYLGERNEYNPFSDIISLSKYHIERGDIFPFFHEIMHYFGINKESKANLMAFQEIRKLSKNWKNFEGNYLNLLLFFLMATYYYISKKYFSEEVSKVRLENFYDFFSKVNSRKIYKDIVKPFLEIYLKEKELF